MRHWSQLGMRNWRVKPGRTAGALAAIALGVGVVIWVTCAYESVRLALADQVWFWIGRSHLSVESIYGPEGTVFHSIADEVAALPTVTHVTARLQERLVIYPLPDASDNESQAAKLDSQATAPAPGAEGEEVQAIGIDPATEYVFRQYDDERVEGRSLRADDTDAALVERGLAQRLDLKLGDQFLLMHPRPYGAAAAGASMKIFRVVGFVEHRRVAKQQLPIVVGMLPEIQAVAGRSGELHMPGSSTVPEVTRIDMILHDTAPAVLRATEIQVRRIVNRHQQGFVVSSAQAKLEQVQSAERQTGFVLLLISSVALFTAFFVILSTLSMGMVERIGQLGTLRCLGATRGQVAGMVLAEAVPLGIVGILAGVPVGLGLARLSVWMAPEYIGHFAISQIGLILALAGGAATTLLGALLPMVQAMRVSPLAASRPQSRPPATVFIWLAGALGLAAIAAHSLMIRWLEPSLWFVPLNAVTGVTLLYIGYALLTPALVVVAGQAAVWVVARLLGIRRRLLSDQVGRAAWRSAAICCGLMVGLSLIVSLVVHSRSLAAGWDFPKDFSEAFVYVSPPVPRERAEEARSLPGVGSNAVVNVSIRCTIQGRGLFRFPFSRFVAGDPEEFFEIANLQFLEGTKAEAIEKLHRGGYILVTPEFVRSQRVGYGERVWIKADAIGGHGGYFEVAGVVTSPSLDIAANYFNAGGMLAATSALVVMGTQSDARQVLRVPHEVSMFLLNFDLPDTPPPPAFEEPGPPSLGDLQELARLLIEWGELMPERKEEIHLVIQQTQQAAQGGNITAVPGTALSVFRSALAEEVVPQWSSLSPEERWRGFREEMVMRLIAQRTGASFEDHASVRALKLQIDRDLQRATILFTTIPMVALIVAALGVGNLMMANVTSRSRQLAMLRAIGATKWQVTRLVIGEAVVLGTLGSLLGLALGLHAAYGMNLMTRAIWGYVPKWTIPWEWVGMGIGFTMLVCLIAGIIPARHAARNNIIDAMQTT